jgi:DNA processing protein
MVPQARHFPLRNRLIAGLSRAVVVVEAAARSGSLITARDALDLGRDVLAVPGHPFDARAAGCNMLIRDGAVLVQGAADVLAAIGVPQVRVVPDCEVVHAPEAAVTPQVPLTVPVPGAKVRTLADMAGLHLQILARLGPSPTAEDQLIRDLALPAAAVAPELVALEMDGKIARQAGGLLSRM